MRLSGQFACILYTLSVFMLVRFEGEKSVAWSQIKPDGYFDSAVQGIYVNQRASDMFRYDVSAQMVSATRFLPVLFFRGIGEWGSPRSVIAIDGQPYGALPLNLVSIDILPFDLILIDSLEIVARPSLQNSGVSPGGSINLRRRTIPDTLTFSARVFVGSETGDPLIYRFTRRNLSFVNKNRIDFSGAVSISNRIGAMAYRITAGTFSYFSTGSSPEADNIILRYNPEIGGKNNRHIHGAAEIEYLVDHGAKLSIYAGILTLRGWEMTPFISNFVHVTGHTNTVRVSIENLRQGLSIHARRDGNLLKLKEQLGTPSGEFGLAEYVFSPQWLLQVSHSFQFSIKADVALQTVDALRNEQERSLPQVFSEDLHKINWGIKLNSAHQLLEFFSYGVRIRYDRHHSVGGEMSGELRMNYKVNPAHTVQFEAASIVYLPNLLELSGRFITMRDRPSLARTDTFEVSGNSSLLAERVNGLTVSYTYRNNHRALKMGLEAFVQRIDNPIVRDPLRSLRSADPGDIVSSSRYVNSGSHEILGAMIGLSVQPLPLLHLSSSYRFVNNNDVSHFPRHYASFGANITFPTSTILALHTNFVSKTLWKEFSLKATEDDRFGTGFDARVPEAVFVDISIEQDLEGLFSANGLKLRLEVQNFFNSDVRRLPVGNPLDTAVLVYLALDL